MPEQSNVDGETERQVFLHENAEPHADFCAANSIIVALTASIDAMKEVVAALKL